MNMKRFAVFGFALMAVLVLAACSSQQGSTTSSSAQPVQATSANGSSDSTSVQQATEAPAAAATPTIDVDALIREKLAGHHSIDRVYAAHHTREEWNATLDRMIQYGAKINDQEKQIIIDYLLQRQGN